MMHNGRDNDAAMKDTEPVNERALTVDEKGPIYWGDEVNDFLEGRGMNPFGARPRVQLEILRGRALKYLFWFAFLVLIIYIVLSSRGAWLRWECRDPCGRSCSPEDGLPTDDDTPLCPPTTLPYGYSWASSIDLTKYNYDVIFVVSMVPDWANSNGTQTNPAIHTHSFESDVDIEVDGDLLNSTSLYNLNCDKSSGCKWYMVHGAAIGGREGTWNYNVTLTPNSPITLPQSYHLRLVILTWAESYTTGEAVLRYIMIAWTLYFLPYFLWKNFGRPSMLQDWLTEHVWGAFLLVFLLCYLNPMFLPGLAHRHETDAAGKAYMAFEVLLSWVFFIILYGFLLIVPLSVAFGRTRWLWVKFGRENGGVFIPSVIMGGICVFFLLVAIRDFLHADGERYLQNDSKVPRSMAANTLLRHTDNHALTLVEKILFYSALGILFVTLIYCRYRLCQMPYTSVRLKFLAFRVYILFALPYIIISMIIRWVEYANATPLYPVTSTAPDSVRDILLFSVLTLIFGHFFTPIYSGYTLSPPPPHSLAWLHWKWSSDWFAWWTHYGKSLYIFLSEEEERIFEGARSQRLTQALQDKTEQLFEKNQRFEARVVEPTPNASQDEDKNTETDSVASAANQKFKQLVEMGLRLNLPDTSPRRSITNGDSMLMPDTARGMHSMHTESVFLSARGGGIPLQNASVAASFRVLKKLDLKAVKSPPLPDLGASDEFGDIEHTESVMSNSPRFEDSLKNGAGLFKVLQIRSPLMSPITRDVGEGSGTHKSFKFLGELAGIEVPTEAADEKNRSICSPPAEGPYRNFLKMAHSRTGRPVDEDTSTSSVCNDPFELQPKHSQSSFSRADKDQGFRMPIFCLESCVECFNASWLSYMLDCEEGTPYHAGQHLPKDEKEDAQVTWYGDYSRVPTEYKDEGSEDVPPELLAMNHKRCDYFIHGVHEGQAMHQELSWVDSWLPGGVHRDLLYNPEGDLIAWRIGAEEWEGSWRMPYQHAVAWLKACEILNSSIETPPCGSKWTMLLLLLKKTLLSNVDASLLILDGWAEDDILTDEEYEERRAFLRGQVWVMCNLPQETLIQIPEITPTICTTRTTIPTADITVAGVLTILAESVFSALLSWEQFVKEMVFAIETKLSDRHVFITPYDRAFPRSCIASEVVEWAAKHYRCTTGEAIHALDIMRQQGLLIPCIHGSYLRVSCDGTLWRLPHGHKVLDPNWELEDAGPWGQRRVADMLTFATKEGFFKTCPPEPDAKPKYQGDFEYIHTESYGYKLEAVITVKSMGLKAILMSSPMRVILAFRGTDNDQNVELDLDMCPGPFDAHDGWGNFYANMRTKVGRATKSLCGCAKTPNSCCGPHGCYTKYSAMCHQMVYGSKPQCHFGFINAWMAMEKCVYQVLSTICPVDDKRQVFLTGHSLGGALAQMAAYHITWKMYRRSKKVKVYAFSSPRVGNLAFAAAYDTFVPDTFRVNMNGDPVTNIPPSFGRARYHHAGTEVHLGRSYESASWCIDPTWLDSGAFPMPRPQSHTLGEINRALNNILEHFSWDSDNINMGLKPAGEPFHEPEPEEEASVGNKESGCNGTTSPDTSAKDEESLGQTTTVTKEEMIRKKQTYVWPWVRVSKPDLPEIDIARYDPSELCA